MTFTVDAIADCGISGGAATVPPEWKGNQMKTLRVEFAEYLMIKSALREAVADARAESRRGQRFENYDMANHYEEQANALESLIEKLDGQTFL